VGVLGSAQRAGERCVGAAGNGNAGHPTQFEQAQVVLANPFYRNVSRGRRDTHQLGVIAGEQVQQCERVVNAGVDVGEDG
jgi:hypothetical protein